MLGHADMPGKLPMKLNEFTAVCSDFQGTITSQSVSIISLNTDCKSTPSTPPPSTPPPKLGKALLFEFTLSSIMIKINHGLTVIKFHWAISKWRYPVGVCSASIRATHYVLRGWSLRLGVGGISKAEPIALGFPCATLQLIKHDGVIAKRSPFLKPPPVPCDSVWHSFKSRC